MTMQIEIVESQVTFGELPDGAVVKMGSLSRPAVGMTVMKHAEEMSGHACGCNAIRADGMRCRYAPDMPVGEVLWLPPGASLKRKAKMVRVEDAGDRVFLFDGGLCKFFRMTSASTAEILDWPNRTGLREIRFDTLVQLGRFEGKFFPEYEA